MCMHWFLRKDNVQLYILSKNTNLYFSLELFFDLSWTVPAESLRPKHHSRLYYLGHSSDQIPRQHIYYRFLCSSTSHCKLESKRTNLTNSVQTFLFCSQRMWWAVRVICGRCELVREFELQHDRKWPLLTRK